MQMKNIKLAAFDMDGTLMRWSGDISDRTVKAIQRLAAGGVEVVIATGRDYAGIPMEAVWDTGVRYLVTVNGSTIYEMKTKKCLYDEFIDFETAGEMIRRFLDKRVVMVVYSNGQGVYPKQMASYIPKLAVPAYIKNSIQANNEPVEDIFAYLETQNNRVQKITYFLQKDEGGCYVDEDELLDFLSGKKEISFVDGGVHNYECTKAGADKGKALQWLCDYLEVPMEAAMAVGDSENDLAMLRAAGLGVAMGNASEAVKAQVDIVTGTNEEDGAAQIMEALMEQLYETD